MRCHRIWSLRVLGVAFGLLSCVALVNLLVDPLGIYRLFIKDGFNANKSFAIKHTRLVKPYMVEKLAAHSIALGTSRIEVGIDPEHPAWPEDWKPVYNYGLEGTSTRELTENLEYALSVAPLRSVLFGLDFHMFKAKDELHENWEGKLRLHLKALLSLDSLRASRKTLRKQDPEDDPELMENGQVGWAANLRRVRKYGHRHDFLNTERSFLKKISGEDASRAFVTPDALASLQLAMELCRQHGVAVVFCVPPIHVRMLEVYFQSGRYQEFLDWKAELARLIDENNRVHGEQPPFLLYDFSTVNPITTEAVPALDDRSMMKYFWETSHCRKEAGDLVIARVFGTSAADALPAEFGRLLTLANSAEVLSADRQAFLEYRAQHPDMVDEIAKLKVLQ